MNLTFRLETAADHHAVEEMTRNAFWKFWGEGLKICDEHFLVSKLRKAEAFVPELNYIVELDGNLAGHIIYTKSWIESENGEKHETLTFGPLTVSPEYQRNGIGQALMKHSFAEAKRLGYRAVLIFGHPNYYPRAGFKRASEFGITTSDGSSFDAFMVYILYEGALDGIQGKYFIDSVYENLSQEEVFEFDKRFPPKQPHQLTPIDILLEQLDPEAAKSLQDNGLKYLDEMTSRSYREILSLPGINEKVIDTIKKVLHERNFPW